MKRILLATACLVFATSASARFDLGMTKTFGQFGWWTLGYDDDSNGCVIGVTYPKSGTRIWVGYRREAGREDTWYVAFTGEVFDWVAVNESNRVIMQFPSTGYQIEFSKALGIRWKDHKGLLITNFKREFWQWLKDAKNVIVVHNGQSIVNLNLDGSSNALDKVVDCQRNNMDTVPSPRKAEPKPAPKPKEKMIGSGTGFFVTNKHVMTNNHVIEKCGDKIQLSNRDMWGPGSVVAKVVAQDAEHDLALLESNVQSNHVAKLHIGPISLGESVWVYGFPLQDILSAPNFTSGMIAATSGLKNNVNELQITAPVQPGNSGSPLLDKFGNVVGVVDSKLNAIKVSVEKNDIPQNINFAVKASVAISFMSTNGIESTTSTESKRIDPVEIAKTAQSFTINIRCEVKAES